VLSACCSSRSVRVKKSRPQIDRTGATRYPHMNPPYFQAGHTSSILVTRSTTTPLVLESFVLKITRGRLLDSNGRATPGPLLPRRPADSEVKGSRNLAVRLAGRMLVDQRCAHAAVAHPVHQLTCARALAAARLFPVCRRYGSESRPASRPSPMRLSESTDRWKLFRRTSPQRSTKYQLVARGQEFGQVLRHDLD
jgi:hypothetical protein